MTATYIPISSVTLSSTATEVVFSALPQTFSDLIIVMRARNNGSGTVSRWTFNGDNGNNYFRRLAVGLGTVNVTDSIAGTNTFLEPHYYSDVDNTYGTNLIMQLMDYSVSNKHKAMLFRNNQVGMAERGSLMGAARWASTDPINSIRITLNTGAFDSGSTFTIWGVIA